MTTQQDFLREAMNELAMTRDAFAARLAIAANEGNGQLVVAPAPNQSVLDVLSTPTPKY